MLAETIKTPEEYLNYSKQTLIKTNVPETCPKIFDYYQELYEQFVASFYEKEVTLFVRWGKLLGLDAQIQILLELTRMTQSNLAQDLDMSEEEIIRMIRHDKSCFYRELTGGNTLQKPRWGLIYLSEEELINEDE